MILLVLRVWGVTQCYSASDIFFYIYNLNASLSHITSCVFFANVSKRCRQHF